MSKTKNKKAGKSAKDKLAAGAAKIKKAQEAEAEKKRLATPVVIPASTRPIEEIIKERVTVLPGSIGLEVSPDTPIEENLRILDWTLSMSEHVGWMVGDVLVAGETNKVYGEMYERAVTQTGKALKTLQNYKMVAKTVPPSKRIAALSFSHYKNIQGLLAEPKVIDLVEKVGKEVTSGRTKVSVSELRIKALNVAPRKRKKLKPSKPGSKRGKSKAKKELPAYKPTDEEQSHLDVAEEAIIEAAKAVKEGGVFKLVLKLDNKEKQRWLKFIEPLVTFYNQVDRVMGY